MHALRETWRAAALLSAVLVFPTAWGHAEAVGTPPVRPYHYLHPSAVHSLSDRPPVAGKLTLAVRSGQSSGGTVFTADHQFGIQVPTGAFLTGKAATSIQVALQAVDIPRTLPPRVRPDGNGYLALALGQPGNLPINILRKVRITLRWPRIPVAVYEYVSGQWHRLCSSRQAILTSQSINCSAQALGIFVAVTSTKPPAARSTPTDWSPYGWAGGAASSIALLLAALGFVAARRKRSAVR